MKTLELPINLEELIKVELNENQEPVVSGRMLHKFLEVKTAYKDWFSRMAEYGFIEDLDFCSFLSKSTGGRPSTDHLLKMDMAKEISMIQRSEKGKQARQYFINLEKNLMNDSLSIARVMKLADKRIRELEEEVQFLRKGYDVIKSVIEKAEMF